MPWAWGSASARRRLKAAPKIAQYEQHQGDGADGHQVRLRLDRHGLVGGQLRGREATPQHDGSDEGDEADRRDRRHEDGCQLHRELNDPAGGTGCADAVRGAHSRARSWRLIMKLRRTCCSPGYLCHD